MPSEPGRLSGEDRPVILIVDDSGLARKRLRRFLADEGWERIVEAADGDEALVRFAEHRPAVVLIDQVMRGIEGIETVRLLRERDPQVRVFMLTVVSDPELHERAREVGILQVINKSDKEALREALAAERGH